MNSALPYLPLFSSTLLLGTFIAISSNQWIYVWMGLEINILSFVPLIISTSNNQETESAVKYFLAQATGSGLLLLGALNHFFSPLLFTGEKISIILILLGLITKLGIAPCHFWFPSVIAGLSWIICLILSTWQKLIPLLIIIFLIKINNTHLSLLPAALRRLIGGLGGLNQTQLRPLLAYSSIGHLGWIFATRVHSSAVSMIYFLTYALIITSVIVILNIASFKSLKHFSSLSKTPILLSSLIILTLLSLGGLPPITGFLPKWAAIDLIINTGQWTLLIILISGSLINLSYYLNIIFNLILKTDHSYKLKSTILSTTPILISIPACWILPLILLIIPYAMTILNKS